MYKIRSVFMFIHINNNCLSCCQPDITLIKLSLLQTYLKKIYTCKGKKIIFNFVFFMRQWTLNGNKYRTISDDINEK